MVINNIWVYVCLVVIGRFPHLLGRNEAVKIDLMMLQELKGRSE
jgi:hypothetical protein